MSNRPKGFKRMPIFIKVDELVKVGGNIIFKEVIKSIDKRLPNDERYHRKLIHLKNIGCGKYWKY